MLHEVLDASRPAAEVPLQTRPHDAPSQPGAVAHRVVRVLDAQHVLLNQVHDLAVERGLEAVGDVTGQLLPEVHGLLADRRIELHRPLDGARGRLHAADHFHQRNDVRRIERMSHQAALGVRALRLHDAGRDAGRARRDDRVRRSRIVHVGEQLHLEIRPLGAVFLNEVRRRQRLLHVGREGQLIPGRAGGQADARQHLPRLVDVLAELRLRVRRRVGGDHVEPARQIECGQACADDSGADDRDGVNGLVVGHDHFSLAAISA